MPHVPPHTSAKRKRRQPERSLHRSIAEYFDRSLGANVWWTTFPAGGGGKTRGAILKGMGLKDGVPDILIIYRSKPYWIEVKVKRGYLSAAQIVCHAELLLAGAHTIVVKSIEDTEATLLGWGIPLRAKLVA